ncbi:MAG: hypothetical protein ACOX19_10415 [Fermentimonas sp.]
MNCIRFSLLLLIIFLPAGCTRQTAPKENDYAAWVDPFIGTDGHGQYVSGRYAPFWHGSG